MPINNRVLFQVDIESGEVWLDAEWTNNWPSGKQVMEPSATLRFRISYPLANPTLIELTHEDGAPWTQQQFIEAVRTAYKRIYQEEEAAVGNPGHASGLLNRAPSNGPYGIRGHDLADLVLEGASKQNDVWELMVGS